MDVYTIALVVVGVIILLGLLIQFRLTSAAGVVFALAAVGAVIGLSLCANARRKRLLADLKKREDQLGEQEKKLEQLLKEYELSQREIEEAQEAIRRDKVAYMKRVLVIDAEKEKKVAEIERMTPAEVLKAFGEAYGP